MQWYNEPKNWKNEKDGLHFQVDPDTDFWQNTHYGFKKDDGHFFWQEVTGDFTATVTIIGSYRALYDQAGLMMRIDSRNWVKAGIEFLDGAGSLSCVVTREFSDWSISPWAGYPEEIMLRLRRKGDSVEIVHLKDYKNMSVLRLAYFPPAASVKIGMMAAAPKGPGFGVEFKDFRVEDI